MSAPRRIRLFHPSSIFAFGLLAVVCLALSLTPLRSSHDEWWHLKTGRYIDEHGLADREIFTYTAENIAWHNHEWLAQLGMWRLYRWGETAGVGGVRAIIFFKAAFITITFVGLGIFTARQMGAPALACLVAAIACALSRRTLYPRPPFITYGLMALALGVMITWRARKIKWPRLLLLPPLFALWANLHGGFMAGLVILGAFCGESLVAWMLACWRLEETREPRARFLAGSGILLACSLATLATPYGYHLYELAGRVMSDTELASRIFELRPANWRFVWALDAALLVMLFAAIRPRTIKGAIAASSIAVALLFVFQILAWIRLPASSLGNEPPQWETNFREAIALLLITGACARSKETVGPAQWALAIFFAHQAIQHVRHLPLLGIVLAPVMAQTLADWIRGTVGGWDWLWRIKAKAEASREFQEELRGVRIRGAHHLALGGLIATVCFYLFLPQESFMLVQAVKSGRGLPPSTRKSLLDRNLALLRDRGKDSSRERGTEPNSYPKAAADFLLAHRPPGRLWNGGNYAGYLIWRLSPESYKVFTDNRYDIYGGRFIREEWIVLNAFEGDVANQIPNWNQVLEKWSANTLFIPSDSPLHVRLTKKRHESKADSAWRLIYSDPFFSIWNPSVAGSPEDPASF